MKKLLIFLIFNYSLLISTQSVRAQNLVPNYSFEDTIHCTPAPDNYEYIGYVANWANGGTCAYFNSCGGNVPYNGMGYQYAHTGNAYVGLYAYIDGEKDSRGYIQDQLTAPLVSGIKYYVIFFVSLADSFMYACTDMGAYLSDSALSYSGPWPNAKPYLIPQIANNKLKDSLTNKTQWIKISGSYVATGGEQYIIIGNFKDDAHSDTIFVGSGGKATYDWYCSFYFIDDVIVSADSNYADSLAGVNELKVESEKLKVFPNPSDGKFTFQLIISNEQLGIKNTVEVYNELGQKVASTPLNLPQGRDFEIDLTSQPSGIYFYRVTTQQGELVGSGKLIIE